METDGAKLLKIIKPPKGKRPPAPGRLPHDELILHPALNPPSTPLAKMRSEETPTLLVLCGPPGAGKSATKKQLLKRLGVDTYVSVDPDDIRTQLMKAGVDFPDPKTMSGLTNKFNERLSDFVLSEKFNIVFDTTGRNYSAVNSLVRKANEVGYNTNLAVIYASRATCLRRVEQRNVADTSGRIPVPLDVAAEIYDAFLKPKGVASMLLLDYPVPADQVFLWNNDTDGADPELLFHQLNGGKVETVVPFAGFFNMDINPEPPYLTKNEGMGGGSKRGKHRETKKLYSGVRGGTKRSTQGVRGGMAPPTRHTRRN